MRERDRGSEIPKGGNSLDKGRNISGDRQSIGDSLQFVDYQVTKKPVEIDEAASETKARKTTPIITSIRELPASGGQIKKATLAEITLIERNQHVPFPELDKKEGLLEKLVLDSAKEKLLPHDQLPDTIAAGNIETYANWISELTEKDPQSAERGAVLHVPARSEGIIFPSDPDIGDENSCESELAEDREKFLPTINIHSHPGDYCHSPGFGDMGTLLAGWKAKNFIPRGILVATPRHNYLMIKSQETLPAKNKWAVNGKAYAARDDEEMGHFPRFGSSLGISMDSSEYRELYYQAEKQTFRQRYGFEAYYRNFTDAIILTEAYDLGFYRSNKDGNYKRFTREEVKEHMTDFFTTALDNAMKR